MLRDGFRRECGTENLGRVASQHLRPGLRIHGVVARTPSDQQAIAEHERGEVRPQFLARGPDAADRMIDVPAEAWRGPVRQLVNDADLLFADVVVFTYASEQDRVAFAVVARRTTVGVVANACMAFFYDGPDPLAALIHWREFAV